MEQENQDLKKQNQALEKRVRFQVIAELQAKLGMLASDEKTSEPQPPPSLEPPLSLPPAPVKPSTDQRTSADKSLTQIKQFFRDRSPEISEPMIVSDSDEDGTAEESEIQFTPKQSIQERNEKAKRKKQAKAQERYKMLMDTALKRSEPWKCGTCSIFFRTAELLRQHNLMEHKEKKKFCNRCPYLAHNQSDLTNHENMHSTNDVKFKTAANGRECKLCHIWFGTNGHLVFHLRQFHLPKPSK